MGKTDIGPKIGIEGEAQFRKELNEINQGLKVLDSEAKAVAATMQDETDAEKKSAAMKDVLERKILSQSEKLEKLKQGLEASAKKYGEADTRTQKWQKAVYDATADLANMEHEIKGLDNAVDETTDSMEQSESAATGWADVMKGSLCADMVKNGVKALAQGIKEAATALWDASKAGAAYADKFNTMAAETGLSTDTLQEYAYMADLVDVSLETLTGAQSKLINNMRKARDGTGDAAEAWAAMGINITDANGNLRSNEDVLNETLAALAKIENETERDAAAMAIFGKSAQELNPMIKAGADQLEELRREAHDTGYVLSGSALTALNKQQDAMDRLSKRVEAVSNRFATKLAPGITRGTEALNNAFENPRVKRGIDLIADGIGKATNSVMELAANALPKLFQVFSLGDIRLRTYTDEQLELVNQLEEVKAAHEEMISSFEDRGKSIVAETERTENLWKELQNLVDENGNVKEADAERVRFITGELKEALGVQMELENGILNGYKEQQAEIDKLIKKREAEALMAAGAEEFAKAQQDANKAMNTAAQLYPQIAEREKELQKAEEELAAARERSRQTPGYQYQGEQYVAGMVVQYVNAVNAQKEALEAAKKDYAEANAEAAGYFATVDKWERAQMAAANDNYEEVVRILTSEFEVSLKYYQEKKLLSMKERQELKDKLKEAELNVAEYKRNLQAGLQGFSEAGLKEMERYVVETKRILNGEDVGEMFIVGIASGILNKQSEAFKAAWQTATGIEKAAKQGLSIASPSKKGIWIGQMFDEGLIKGMESLKAKLKESAGSLGDSMLAGSWPGAYEIGTGAYGGAISAPIGSASNSYSYTTDMGGLTINVYGGSTDARELARQITAQLTNELNRSRRGGGG